MADLNQTTETVLKVNGQQASETLQSLRKRAEELRESIVKAMAEGDTKGAKQLQKALTGVNREIKSIQSSAANVEQTLKNLDKAAPNDLRKTLQVLERQLQSIERGSSAWNAQVEKIKQVKAQIKMVNEELAVHETFMQRVNRTFNNWGQSIMAAAASVTGLVMAGKKAVSMYADMDQEMSSVRKFTGMTAEEVERMNEEFKKIDTRTSRDNLNKLAQEAGRLGKTSQEDVLGFVKAADKINVALDDLGDGATLTLSKLTNIFGDEAIYGTEQSLLKVGSVINELSQNCTASAPYLAEFAQRLAGVGAQAGLTIPQIMGFGAVLDSNGQAVEMSASALSKLIMNLFKQADKIAAATGLNLKKFKETAAKDTNEALIMLLERLHELGNMDVLAPLFKEMGENGVRSSQVLAALAGNIETVKKQQQAANIAFEEGTSIQKEFDVQNTNVKAGLEKARKGFQEMAVTLGKELMPIVSHLISGSRATMRVMLQVVKFIKEHRGAIITLASAYATYQLAVNKAAIANKALNVVTKAGNAISATQRVVTLASSLAYNKLTGNVTRAAAAQKLLNQTIKLSPWGLVLSAVTAIGIGIDMLIKKHREENELLKAQAGFDKQVNEEYTKSAAKIKALNTIVHNGSIAYSERKKALDELRSIVPGYHAELTKEGELINDNKTALDDYLESLRQSIRIKAAQDKIEGAMTSQLELEPQLETAQERYDAIKARYDSMKLALQKAIDEGNKTAERGIRTQLYGANGDAGFNITAQLRDADRALTSIKKKYDEYQSVVDKFSKVLPKDNGVVVEEDDTKGKKKGNGDPTAPTDSPAKDRFKEEEDWLKREQALNEIAYAQGKASYEEYTHGKLELEEQFQTKRLAKCEKGTTEYLEVMAAHEKAVAAMNASCLAKSVQQENERWKKINATLDQSYADGKISYTIYNRSIELAELEHLRNMVQMYKEGTQERIKAEEEYIKRDRQIQQKHIEEDRKIQEKFRTDFFTKAYRTPDEEGFKNDLKNLEIVHQQMLTATEGNKSAQLRVERAFQEAKYLLSRKYNIKIADDTTNAFRSGIDDAVEWLNSDGGKAMTGALNVMIQGMSSMFEQLSTLVKAELEIETAKIEDSYRVQIEAAEGNKSKTVALESQKQKEIAQAKNEANKKMFAMEVLQAVAQTAMSAINAFSSAAAVPIIGYILAPIAASMAVAAGAIQIANIKKQQEAAASTGYAKGRKGGKAEFALIGEEGPEVMYIPQGASIVPNNKLQSPQEWEQYGVPTFSAIDEAQRTNTLGSLSRRDVSRSISAPQVIAETTAGGQLQAGMAAQATTNAETAKAIARLNKRLNDPFVTVNTVTGDKGIRQAQDNYDRLMKNATRKSK